MRVGRRRAALQTTAGSWVVFMGDSITRHLFEAYLQVMDPDFLAQAPKRGVRTHRSRSPTPY
jgi:hypothetical protein